MNIKSICHECGVDVVRRKQTKDVKVHFCSMACKANYQRRAKPVTKEWLIEHYIEKGMDCVQISEIVKRDPKSVWNWLKDFGIPTRPRGTGWDKNLIIGSGSDSAFYGKKHTEETKEKIRKISIEQGRVPFDPSVGSYMKGRKGDQTPNWKGGITADRQACYSSKEWCEAVKVVWKRDDAKCQICGRSKAEDRDFPFDIHHIIGFKNVRHRTNPDNLVLLCETCHYWAHSKKNTESLFIARDDKEETP